MIELEKVLHFNRIKQIGKIYSDWLSPGAKVLDVGCGDGILAYALSRKLNISITGCDIKNYLKKPIKFKLMKYENTLPFGDFSFDTVCLTDVLHHVLPYTQEALIRQSLRVARKNVIILEPKPTAGVYIADFLINIMYYPGMKIPFTYQHQEAWVAQFHSFPVKVDIKYAPRLLFSVVSHVAYNLQKRKG